MGLDFETAMQLAELRHDLVDLFIEEVVAAVLSLGRGAPGQVLNRLQQHVSAVPEQVRMPHCSFNDPLGLVFAKRG